MEWRRQCCGMHQRSMATPLWQVMVDLAPSATFCSMTPSWLIRWLVVDTGNWLSGRKVLLPPSVLGHPDVTASEFSVRLTMQQVKDSPDIETDRPVSRQMEANVYDYYGWSPIGVLAFTWAAMAMRAAPCRCRLTRNPGGVQRQLPMLSDDDDDPHLRSIAAVTGYHIHASDGEIGHVEDFLLEDADWSIHFLVVDTTNWWAGKKVLISPRSAREIDWTDQAGEPRCQSAEGQGQPAIRCVNDGRSGL